MSLTELRASGARDVFGHFFRDWHVVGWEEGKPPAGYVCWLPIKQQHEPVIPHWPTSPQLELFA